MPTLIRGGRILRSDLQTCDVADMLVDRGVIQAIEPPGAITDQNVEIGRSRRQCCWCRVW